MAGVSLASGWIGVGINKMLGEKNSMQSAGTAVWIASPLATVVATRLLRKEPVNSGWYPNLPQALPTYIVGSSLFPAVTMTALKYGQSRGWVSFENADMPGHLQQAGKNFAPSLVKNVLEEAVWRGYFTHELLNASLSTRSTNLTVGLIWSLWHLPYYLYFLPEEEIRSTTDVSREQFAALSVPVLQSWTVPYTELYRSSGSIWPSVLAHAIEDVFVNGLVSEENVEIKLGKDWLVGPVNGAITLALYPILGIAMRKWLPPKLG